MVSHLFYYHLAFFALVWLFVMLHVRSCTRPLRIIISPRKPGTMPVAPEKGSSALNRTSLHKFYGPFTLFLRRFYDFAALIAHTLKCLGRNSLVSPVRMRPLAPVAQALIGMSTPSDGGDRLWPRAPRF